MADRDHACALIDAIGDAYVRAGRRPEGEPRDVRGFIVQHGEGLALTTADGRLVLESVKPAGGRAMTGSAFLRGRPGLVGSVSINP